MHNVEHLENRRLFSSDPTFTLTSKGTLIVQGGDGNEEISAALFRGNPNGLLYVTVISQQGGPHDDFVVDHQTKIRYFSVKRLVIDGGDGNDTISVNDAHITKPVSLLGGNGDDKITFEFEGPVFADGGAGNDTIGGYSPQFFPSGKTKNRDILDEYFSLQQNSAPDTILGGDGDDTLGGNQNDVIDGGNGNDTITANVVASGNPNMTQQHADALVHDFFARIGATGIETSSAVLY